MSPLASSFACAPSGRNARVCAGTVMEEKEKFWSYSLRHWVRKWNYTFPEYFTTLPDLSIRSRTPILFTITLSVWLNAVLHCSHRCTPLGQSLWSSLLTNWYCLPWTLSGFKKSIAGLSFDELFATYNEKRAHIEIIPQRNAYSSLSPFRDKPRHFCIKCIMNG